MSDQYIASVDIADYHLGNVKRIEVREAHGKHMVAIVDFYGVNRKVRMPPENTPVTLTWGIRPNQVRQAWGYVNHRENTATKDAYGSSLRLYLIGITAPFNDPLPTSWSSVSPSYIVRQVGERHKLRVVAHTSKEVLDYWAQGIESDWAMLRRLADRVGYRFWVDGVTLYFLDPERLLRRSATDNVPTLRLYRLPGDNLIEFQSTNGSMVPRESPTAVREVFGIDKESGIPFKMTSTKGFTDRQLDVPARTVIHPLTVKDMAEAHRVADAQVSRGRWASAEATTIARVAIKIGDVVNVEGALHQDDLGYWLVDGVTSVMERDKGGPFRLTADLTLSRNQGSDLLVKDHTRLTAPRNVRARLVNGVWESNSLESISV